MARQYKRDANGRFAGGGGGSSGKGKGGSKAGNTRKANAATDARLQGKGLVAVGSRLRKKTGDLYQGAASTKARNAAGWAGGKQTASPKRKATTAGAGTRSMLQANAKKAGQQRSRAASKGTKKMAPAPVNATKKQYQALRSQQRQDRRYESSGFGRSGGARAATTRQVNAMVANRGVSKKKKR